MIKALTHVAIRVTDIERAIAFYVDGLGMTEQFRLHDGEGRPHLVYLRVGERQFIELFTGAHGHHTEASTPGLVHICLEVDDIHATYRAFAERGAVSLRGEPILAADRTWQFWTSDPDGNPIEFQQFTPDSMQIG